MYVSLPHAGYSVELQIALMVMAGACLFMFQAQPISRKRLIAALAVIVVAIGCTVFADGEQVIDNYCQTLEPYSALWWLYGCWGLPG